MKKGRPFPELISHHPADEAIPPRAHSTCNLLSRNIRRNTHTHTNSVPEKERRATTCFNRIDKHTRSTRALRSRLPAFGSRALRLPSSVKATPTQRPLQPIAAPRSKLVPSLPRDDSCRPALEPFCCIILSAPSYFRRSLHRCLFISSSPHPFILLLFHSFIDTRYVRVHFSPTCFHVFHFEGVV